MMLFRSWRHRSLLLLLGTALFTLGCSGGQPPAQVTGKVTLDGEPLEEGEVTFFSTAGSTGTGVIGPGGIYRLVNSKQQEGVDLGEYIAVVMPSLAQIKKGHGDPMITVKTHDIPQVYTSSGTSPLRYNVVAGLNEIDLVLEKTAPRPK